MLIPRNFVVALGVLCFVSITVSARVEALLDEDRDTRPSSQNCTWKFVEQPLSHFAKGIAGVYKQRLCVYDKYWQPDMGLPVFFYTGNESPVEEYVNNTGLMWSLGQSMQALIVFAEHRYFGESIPTLEGTDNCLGFLSSEEALADYASLCNQIRKTWGAQDSAFVAFGGSYGGMLASWMRILYPSAIDGAIAASAPIWGFPQDDCAVDSSSVVVSYAASSAAGAAENCADNLKASYVLLWDIGQTAEGREALSSALNLCTPLSSTGDLKQFLNYLQSPLFNLAEGSYPFPSDYITFALTGTTDPLPPWAMQVMCSAVSSDYDVEIEGNTQAVNFQVKAYSKIAAAAAAHKKTNHSKNRDSNNNNNVEEEEEDNAIVVDVDWDTTSNNDYTIDMVYNTKALQLIVDATQAIQVWYNVTGTLPSCVDWTNGAPNNNNEEKFKDETSMKSASTEEEPSFFIQPNPMSKSRNSILRKHNYEDNLQSPPPLTTTTTCSYPTASLDAGSAWNALVCNEGINLVNWWAQGVGNDLYWPPNQPKDFSLESLVPGSLAYCSYFAGLGLYGLPTGKSRDVWSEWIDTAYGGLRLQYASNIVFSNGNLDPWSPAGVKATTTTSTTSKAQKSSSALPYTAVNDDGSIISVVIDMGGHHLDLFWPDENDPDSVKQVRKLETEQIQNWIKEAATNKKK